MVGVARRSRSRKAIACLGIAALIVVFLQFYRARDLETATGIKQAIQHTAATPKAPPTTGISQIVEQTKTAIAPREPTHTSCSNSNDNVHGIYHIAMGDIGGAAGTIFYQFVIAQILYAERYHLKPFVHFSNVSYIVYDESVHTTGGVTLTGLTGRNATYIKHPHGHRRDYTPGPPDETLPVQQETMYFPGTGVWNHYFEPISDFTVGDTSCENTLYVTMDLYLITPGLHTYANYTPKCWRYKTLPDYISQPHLGSSEWLEPQRRIAHDIVRRYIRPRSILIEAAAAVNPDCGENSPCLGIHIRHSDKASGRRVIETDEFLPFVEAFLEATEMSYVYLATDSSKVLSHVTTHWPSVVVERIRTMGDAIVRSKDQLPVFDISSHHRTNVEVLVEILALARCQFIVHGFSAVSEAAIWTNIQLHDTSVNLEDEEHIDKDEFHKLVTSVLRKDPKSQWPHPIRTSDIWPDLYNSSRERMYLSDPTHSACNGYDGVLLISNVGQVTAGRAFFSSILNQIAFAERNNLKPWIHLKPVRSSFLYDEQEHGILHKTIHAQMINSSITYSALTGSGSYPDGFSISTAKRSVVLQGNGIWESYFEPVSDFDPNDTSCQDTPLVELDDAAIELLENDRRFIRAWSFPLSDESMDAYHDRQHKWRQSGSGVVHKYYRFQPFVLNRADQANHMLEWDQPCLGVHLRNGDKPEKERKKVSPKSFIPYLEAFVEAGGKMIYVASDSHRALQYLMSNLPDRLGKLIQTQGKHVIRSTKLDWPLYMIGDHHRVNAELLVDIVALSRCVGLLHSFSTTSEAAVYLNPSLDRKSVNLELDNPISPQAFGEMMKPEIIQKG